jgi:hypothetical protein
MAYIRQDEADIRVSVDNVAYGDGNSWATYSGAKLTSPGAKTRVGGMGNEIEVGAPPTRSDVTVTTQASDIMAGQHARLESRVGRGAARVSLQFLDINGNAIPGAAFTVTGKLTGAELPDMTTDTPTVGMYTITVALDQVAA